MIYIKATEVTGEEVVHFPAESVFIMTDMVRFHEELRESINHAGLSAAEVDRQGLTGLPSFLENMLPDGMLEQIKTGYQSNCTESMKNLEKQLESDAIIVRGDGHLYYVKDLEVVSVQKVMAQCQANKQARQERNDQLKDLSLDLEQGD